MLSCHDFYFSDLFLFPGRAYVSITVVRESKGLQQWHSEYEVFTQRDAITMKLKSSYDFYLILATTFVLFAISLISIYGMFYFKFAQIHQLDPSLKIAYMNRMNEVVAPFIICLILLLGICVPKRLLPTVWLNRITVILLTCVVPIGFLSGVKASLFFLLAASLVLQIIVFGMALAGSRSLHFHKKGYWVRLGSSLIHLGLIIFILDLFFYGNKTLHLVLFWVTTGATILGMIFCFYAEAVVNFVTGRQTFSDENIT
jgi:hypothetical protein